jgi:dTDP-glucose 4,6-dehydratase
VTDHCLAIMEVLEKGRVGETYNVGGNNEKTNLEVVKAICAILDELHPGSPVTPHEKLITFVKDRPGHDARYAIDSGKIQNELGWQPQESFETGIRKTVAWYLENAAWVDNVISGEYRNWVQTNYAART